MILAAKLGFNLICMADKRTGGRRISDFTFQISDFTFRISNIIKQLEGGEQLVRLFNAIKSKMIMNIGGVKKVKC